MNNRPKSMTFAAQQRTHHSSEKSRVETSRALPDDGSEARKESTGSREDINDSVPRTVGQRTEIYKNGKLYGSQG